MLNGKGQTFHSMLNLNTYYNLRFFVVVEYGKGVAIFCFNFTKFGMKTFLFYEKKRLRFRPTVTETVKLGSANQVEPGGAAEGGLSPDLPALKTTFQFHLGYLKVGTLHL